MTVGRVAAGLASMVLAGFVAAWSGLRDTASAQEVQLLGTQFGFTVKEVFFKKPVSYLGSNQQPQQARVALKVVMTGEGFSEGSLGPIFYIGDVAANSHNISPDGKMAVAYFYEIRKLPSRAAVSVAPQPEIRQRFKRPFDLSKVKWLSPEIRRKHNLPPRPRPK